MSTRKNSKNVILLVLLVVVVGMAVGYAALSQALVINGTANITAEWKILFTEYPDLREFTAKFYELSPGTILFSDAKTGLYVKAIEGNVKVLEIQGENARKMDVKDFLRGNPLYACSVFE